jgi:hypothetical protein
MKAQLLREGVDDFEQNKINYHDAKRSELGYIIYFLIVLIYMGLVL